MNRKGGCKLCGKKIAAKRLCQAHYSKDRRDKLRALAPKKDRVYVNTGKKCSHTGCKTKAHSRGMCYLHYRRQHEGRPLDSGKMKNAGLACRHKDCEEPAYCLRLCPKHYNVLQYLRRVSNDEAQRYIRTLKPAQLRNPRFALRHDEAPLAPLKQKL